jgi:hypothetical protein
MTARIFDDSEIVPPTPGEDPEARRWLFVLTSPVTVHRDRMLILETDGPPFLPAFLDKASAEEFLGRLGQPAAEPWVVQAMHLVDLRKLAGEQSVEVAALDGRGRVLERLLAGTGR